MLLRGRANFAFNDFFGASLEKLDFYLFFF